MVLLNEESQAECSSAPLTRIQTSQRQTALHDIFLSHSGKQKGFAKDLYSALCPLYITFLDIKQHSLPAGQHFPSRICNAAKTCKVAVVVLSEDFMCSKWPMLELCIFVDRCPDIHILPLFYQLQPADLKCEENLKRWNEKWKGYAEQGGKYPINVAERAPAAVKALCSISGHIYDSSEGVLNYLNIIKSAIAVLVEPSITSDDHLVYGKDRLCKVILDKFEDMEQHLEQPRALVLGLFGPSGSGKSVLSGFLQDQLRCHYTKVLYLKLPGDMHSTSNHQLLEVFKRLLRLTDFQDHFNLDGIEELGQVKSLLRKFHLPSLRVCLVIDNIHEHSISAVQQILELGVGPGSKVILLSRTCDVLQPLSRMRGYRYMFDSMKIPSLLDTEALDLFLHYVGEKLGLDVIAIEEFATDRHRDIALGIVRTSRVGSEGGLLYLPTAVKKIADDMFKQKKDGDDHEHGMKKLLEGQVTSRIKDCSLPGVRDFVLDSFNALPDDEHRTLFLDIALFVIPANIKNMKKALELLCLMHECTSEVLNEKINVLEMRDFVKTSLLGFSVHEVHAQFAASAAERVTHRNMTHVEPLESSQKVLSLRDVTHVEPLLPSRKVLSLRERCGDVQLRTLILQMDDDGCKELALIHCYKLKAIFVRNCKSLEVVTFRGSSYLSRTSSPKISFSIHNCPSLLFVVAPRNVRFATNMRRDYFIDSLLSGTSAELSFLLYAKNRQNPNPVGPLFSSLFPYLLLSLALISASLFSASLLTFVFLVFYFFWDSLGLYSLLDFIQCVYVLINCLVLLHKAMQMQICFYKASHSFGIWTFSLCFPFFLLFLTFNRSFPRRSDFFWVLDFILHLFSILGHFSLSEVLSMDVYFCRATHSFVSRALSVCFLLFLLWSLAFFPLPRSYFFWVLHTICSYHFVWFSGMLLFIPVQVILQRSVMFLWLERKLKRFFNGFKSLL